MFGWSVNTVWSFTSDS